MKNTVIATASAQSQPITKTHSTLLKSRFGLYKIDPRVADFTQKEVQAFTVDIAQYNHVCSEYEAVIKRTDAEVERLKKELEEAKSNAYKWAEYNTKFATEMAQEIVKATENGERRAMERVNVAMAKACCGEGCFDKADFYKELGLDKEVQR